MRTRSNKSNKKLHKSKDKKKSEQLSESELKELMGVYKPTYYRSNGAFRQRG